MTVDDYLGVVQKCFPKIETATTAHPVPFAMIVDEGPGIEESCLGQTTDYRTSAINEHGSKRHPEFRVRRENQTYTIPFIHGQLIPFLLNTKRDQAQKEYHMADDDDMDPRLLTVTELSNLAYATLCFLRTSNLLAMRMLMSCMLNFTPQFSPKVD